MNETEYQRVIECVYYAEECQEHLSRLLREPGVSIIHRSFYLACQVAIGAALAILHRSYKGAIRQEELSP